MIEQRVTLRYDAQQIPAIVQAVQGDTGRDVIFELADYEIPAGATANYYIDKPDGNAVYNSAEVISSTEILAHLTEQALAAPGRNNGQVRILSDGEVITSFDFVLEVMAFKGILHMQSETEVNIFDEAIQAAAEDAIEEIQAQTPVVTGMQNSIAPTYSSSSTYAVGDYVMYNAQLYKCNTAITTAEAWTAAHWTQVPLANDVNDLKADLYENEVFNKSDWENGAISASTGANANNSSRIRTKSFLPWGVTKLYSTNSNVRFLVYAYDSNGAYVGGWWGDGTFNPSDVKGVSSVDFNTIYSNPTYSEYQFRACIYINSDTARVETISDVYIDSLPVVDFIKTSANLTLERVEKIPNNTDFDSLLSAGNYYVENYSSISTMLNTPPEAAEGGRLWVGYGISASRPYQIWLSFSSKNEPYFYMRIYTRSGWGKWNLIKNTEPVNIRVMGYNIGKFNYGYDHTSPKVDNIEEKISNIKRVFGKINPDVMLFAELTDYIDASDTINTDTTLIQPLFKTRVNFHGCASTTNLYGAKKLENDGGVYLRNNNNDYAGTVGRLVCDIGNRKLIISGGFLRVLSSAQDRLEAFKNYINSITDYDYSVIYLDTNVLSNEERETLYSEAVAAGYTVCNGGYFGLINTLVPTDMYKPIDNIFVKGDIKVKNFEVLTSEYDNLASDHLPIVADLTLY